MYAETFVGIRRDLITTILRESETLDLWPIIEHGQGNHRKTVICNTSQLLCHCLCKFTLYYLLCVKDDKEISADMSTSIVLLFTETEIYMSIIYIVFLEQILQGNGHTCLYFI